VQHASTVVTQALSADLGSFIFLPFQPELAIIAQHSHCNAIAHLPRGLESGLASSH